MFPWCALLDDVKAAFAPFLWGEEEEGNEDVSTSFLWTTQPFLPVRRTRLFSSVGFPNLLRSGEQDNLMRRLWERY